MGAAVNKALKKTRILGVLFLLIFMGASWYFLLAPRLAEPAVLQETAEEALTQKQALEAQIATLERREKYLEEAEEAAQQLESRFPWQPDVPTLIQQVQDAAVRSGMSVAQVISIVPGKPTSEGITIPDQGGGSAPAPESNPAPAEGEGNPEGGAAATPAPATPAEPAMARMAVNITVLGTYEQISEFLTQLRLSNRIIIVDKVSMTTAPAADGSLQNQYQANIAGYTVLLPKPPQPPKAQSVLTTPGGDNNAEAEEDSNSGALPTP